jgi:hypothetical protein
MKRVIRARTGSWRAFFDKILKYFVFVLTVVLDLIIVWGELANAIQKPKATPFYIIAHVRGPAPVMMLLVHLPWMWYLTYLGGWSASHMRGGIPYNRFVRHHTYEKTMWNWCFCYVRMCAAVIYHYLLQTDLTNTVIHEVYGRMNKVIIIGHEFNQFMPICMVVVSLLMVFRVWDKMMSRLGWKLLRFQIKDRSVQEMSRAMMIMRARASPEVIDLMDNEAVRSVVSDQPLLATLSSVLF